MNGVTDGYFLESQRSSEELQAKRDELKTRAIRILSSLQVHMQQVGETDVQYMLEGLLAARYLLYSDSRCADSFDKKYGGNDDN